LSKMEFEVTENFYKYSPWLKIWEVIRGLLMLFYVPIAYGKHLFDKIRGIEEPNPREQNVWQNHIEFDTYALESLALSNEESMQLLESETLDFPDWKDWDDPFRFLLKFRSQPEIEALNNTFFDEIDLKTELGIYLIRVNKKGKGMTLCLLPSNKPELIEIAKLKPLSWIMNTIESGTIELLGFADKGKLRTEVKLTTTQPKLH
jgi:hypothetical protein